MNLSEKIRFHCPACDNPVAAPASKAGARMRCPKCKGAVTVPASSGSEADPTPPVSDAPTPNPSPAPVPETPQVSRPGPGMLLRGDWLLFRCPTCETWTKVRRANFNRNVACGVCHTELFLELED